MLLAWLRHEADDYCDDEVDGEGEDGGPEVLRHVAGIVVEDFDPAAVYADGGVVRDGEAVVQKCSAGSGEQACKGSVAGGALPEHAEEKRCEERRIDYR